MVSALPDAVTGAFSGHLADDATVLCLDQYGPRPRRPRRQCRADT
ncbi:hypothetical protein [Kitasatospora sp. NPDC093679]